MSQDHRGSTDEFRKTESIKVLSGYPRDLITKRDEECQITKIKAEEETDCESIGPT